MNNAMSINVDGSPGLMGRIGQKLCAARAQVDRTVCMLDARMRTVTAEYAVVLVAATAFAAVLVGIVKSDVVKTLLTNIIKKVLSVG